jgi:sortase A
MPMDIPTPQRPSPGRSTLLWLERGLLLTGGVLLAVYALARIDSWISSSAALQQFGQEQSPAKRAADVGASIAAEEGDVDFTLWSLQRIRTFRESLPLKQERPLAVLALDRLQIRVPVFDGTDELTLNRGAGWIARTARPGEAGNTGIAGHRDGFFRGLMNIQIGDVVELSTPDRTIVYHVSETEIVNPEDVGVLLPRSTPSLTLVTCYPFYFVGSAPQRFIVHATSSEGGHAAR